MLNPLQLNVKVEKLTLAKVEEELALNNIKAQILKLICSLLGRQIKK